MVAVRVPVVDQSSGQEALYGRCSCCCSVAVSACVAYGSIEVGCFCLASWCFCSGFFFKKKIFGRVFRVSLKKIILKRIF